MMVLIGFFQHTRTPIIWPRPLNCRPLNSTEDSSKNLSQKWENSLLLFICYYSFVTIYLSLFIRYCSLVIIHNTIHLSLFLRYCSLVIIHNTVHSEFCLFKEGYPLCLNHVFFRELPLRTILLLESPSLKEFLVSP